MIFSPLLTLVLAWFAGSISAQGLDSNGNIVYDSIHNATVIVGTWSSGSKAVQTGPNFANPAKMTFNYPKTTGVSFSFSADGFYEIARYRFNGNGSEPTCITGVIGWVHGTYSLNANGSITMTPLGDGFQQIQDPCAAVSNFIEVYDLVEYYQGWRIFQDPTQGFKLHLFEFDGTPVSPQFQVSSTPIMLPTQLLRNDTSDPTLSRRELPGLLERRGTSSARETFGLHWTAAIMGAGVVLLTAATSLML